MSTAVRPESFVSVGNGPFVGMVRDVLHGGHTVGLLLDVATVEGDVVTVQSHAPPERTIEPGQMLRSKVLPDFVSVIERR